MVTREINNIGQPLRGPDGKPLGGVKIEFVLATILGLPSDAIDAISKERYLPVPIYATTSATDTESLAIGEFKLTGIWPTSRADRQVFYRCTIQNVAGARSFVAPVVESEVPLKWSDFSTSGAPLTPAETSGFAMHVQDYAVHLTADQNAALDGAESPSAENPVATIQDIQFASSNTYIGTVEPLDPNILYWFITTP